MRSAIGVLNALESGTLVVAHRHPTKMRRIYYNGLCGERSNVPSDSVALYETGR